MREDCLDLDAIEAHPLSDVVAHFIPLSNSLMTRSVMSSDGWL